MVKPSRQAKACKRKQAYSKKEAEERVILKYARTGRGGYAYHCNACGWWHITKQARNNR